MTRRKEALGMVNKNLRGGEVEIEEQGFRNYACNGSRH